jgi:tRNA (cmo5U34)-methyltransferase
VIDLGCSTGTTLERILAHPACRTGTRAIGIDNAPAMIAQASTRLQSYVSAGRASFSTADLNSEFELPPANVVLMNWTLQFVRPIHRETVLHRVHDCLKPGGALLLSEKVLVEDSLLNRLYIELYYRFKGRQGYTTEEIQRKRESLENVLVPYRVEENLELLHRCGFPSVDMFFRWYNWAGIVAHKV